MTADEVVWWFRWLDRPEANRSRWQCSRAESALCFCCVCVKKGVTAVAFVVDGYLPTTPTSAKLVCKIAGIPEMAEICISQIWQWGSSRDAIIPLRSDTGNGHDGQGPNAWRSVSMAVASAVLQIVLDNGPKTDRSSSRHCLARLRVM